MQAPLKVHVLASMLTNSVWSAAVAVDSAHKIAGVHMSAG